MKANYFIIALFLFFASCEKPSDCFENAGKMVSQNSAVAPFTKVVIKHGIAAVITQADEFSIKIDAPENLISEIKVEIVDGILKVSDNTTCNFTRKYGLTTVHISAPNITEIHSQTEKNITSNGVLNFSNLTLFATDFQDEVGTGDFILELISENLTINTNNISGFYISGICNNLNANFYEGNGILRAENLQVANAQIFQRSSNHLRLNVSSSLKGKILSTGNVHCYGLPAVVEVDQPYVGKLIFL